MESDFQGTKSWNIQEIRTAAAVLQDRYKAVFKELSSELYGIVIGGF
jgi:beta-mannanase